MGLESGFWIVSKGFDQKSENLKYTRLSFVQYLETGAS